MRDEGLNVKAQHREMNERNEMKFKVTTRINDERLGDVFCDDPFHRTTVTIGWQDLLKSLFTRGEAKVEISVHSYPYGQEDEVMRVLKQNVKADEASPAKLLAPSSFLKL